ncbi:hypothetical protein F2P81_019306 [Scophthalmus maximus]|uniref:Uncharacterized protein n=1 Tax=Scophthalmus maximus TaxID=52904 RepID=A0A6A4S6R3_SCOMX|nr:hypothetical protein F2P81_019306 [Scophthalmus maximus]
MRRFFLEHSVYFEESQSSSCDILLFLEFKCIKREPAYIDVVNQYCWRGELMLRCQVFHSKLTHFNRLRGEQQRNLLAECDVVACPAKSAHDVSLSQLWVEIHRINKRALMAALQRIGYIAFLRNLQDNLIIVLLVPHCSNRDNCVTWKFGAAMTEF